MRERVEADRLETLLDDHRKITAGLRTFLKQVSSFASDDATSLRSLSEKAIQAFHEIVTQDMKKIFGDILEYTKVYSEVYAPGRTQIAESLSTALSAVTYFIKVLYHKRYSSEEDFKREVYELSDNVQHTLEQARISLNLLEEESDLISELYHNDNYTSYLPARFYDSMEKTQTCDQTRSQLKTAIHNMEEEVKVIVNFFDSADHRNFSDVINVTGILNGLQTQSFSLGTKVTDFTSCMNYYKNFLDKVIEFMNTNTFTDATNFTSKFYSPEITYIDELKQVDLNDAKNVLIDMETLMAQYTWDKLKIARNFNATLVADIEKQIEALRVAFDTDIKDKFVSSVNSIKTNAMNAYTNGLKYLVSLLSYFNTKESSSVNLNFESKAKSLTILQKVCTWL